MSRKRWQTEKTLREQSLATNLEYERRLQTLGINLHAPAGRSTPGSNPIGSSGRTTNRKTKNSRRS